MPMYAAPGVYVEEVPSGARPIGAVGTSTAAFLGVAPDPDARLGEAVPVNNWTEFCRIFAPEGSSGTYLSSGVYGFFSNGGGRCYVVNLGENGALAGGGAGKSGLQLLEAVDEVAIVAAPGYAGAESYAALLDHCELMEDRVAILDSRQDATDVDKLTEVATVGAPARARTASSPSGGSESTPSSSAGDPPPPPPPSGGGGGERPRQSDYGTFYFPWVVVREPLGRELAAVPPSGHVAGIWARTDMSRGVHKAPANEAVRGALDVTYRVSRQEQEVLNPKGVNCIRFFPTEGIKVWGARTVAAEASPWRYVNVRRLFNMLKESIADGTRWIVFEPNDEVLWGSIRRDVGAFLTRVWRDGALMGRTPQDAFFVKCDAETNPTDVRDAGQVVTLIGVAPVKPAEFVVFKLSQSTSGTESETLGG